MITTSGNARPWIVSRSARISTLMIVSVVLTLATVAMVRAGPPAGVFANETVPEEVLEKFVVSLSASEAVAAMAAGVLTSEQYVGLLLRRIENHPQLNAFIHLDAAQALAAAQATDEARAMGIDLGPLHGLPMIIKDSINTDNMPTTAGTPALDGFQPPENAPVVQALLDAGAVILGKTNLHELSAGYTTTNFFSGATRNPYDFSRIPGGSSGGNGAALAARFAPLAIGEDTAGSTRVPAALTGTMGFRPSTGRYPSEGIVPLAPTLDTPGPMGRTVMDLALADSVITGDFTPLQNIPLDGLRIGIPRAHFRELLDPSVEMAFSRLLDRLSGHGAVLVEADLPLVGETTIQASLVLNLYEVVPAVTEYLNEYGAGITVLDLAAMVASPDVAFLLNLALADVVSEADYLAVLNGLLPALQLTYFDYFASNQLDLLLYPTVPIPAPEVGQQTVQLGGVEINVFDAYFGLAHYTPLVGAPTLSLPLGQLPGGLPVGGVDIAGLPGDDRQVLAIGQAVTKVLPIIRAPMAITPRPLGR